MSVESGQLAQSGSFASEIMGVRTLQRSLRLSKIGYGNWCRLKLAVQATALPLLARLGVHPHVTVVVAVSGCRVPIRLRGAQELLLLDEIFLNRDYGLSETARSALPSAPTVVDLGANVGVASIFLAMALDSHKVVAVEANPALHKRLQKNLERVSGTAVFAAVGNEVSPLTRIYFDANRSLSGSTFRTGMQPTIVATVSLRSIREAMEVDDPVDLVKVDLEGAEFVAFQNAADFEGASVVIMEVHGDLTGSTVDTFLDRFRPAYRVVRIDRARIEERALVELVRSDVVPNATE